MFAFPLEITDDGIRFKYALTKRYLGFIIPANEWDNTRPALLQDRILDHLNWGFTKAQQGIFLFAGPSTKFIEAYVVFTDKVTTYDEALAQMQSDPWHVNGMVEVGVQEFYSTVMKGETVTIIEQLEILHELLDIISSYGGSLRVLFSHEAPEDVVDQPRSLPVGSVLLTADRLPGPRTVKGEAEGELDAAAEALVAHIQARVAELKQTLEQADEE